LDLSPGVKKITLQWAATTPWSNSGFYHRIFRQINGQFILIDSVKMEGSSFQYTDNGTFNSEPLSDTSTYCYYVQTEGSYSNPEIPTPLFNRSQQICASPTDTVKPCPPPDLVIQDPINFSCENCEQQASVTEFSRTIRWKSVAKDTCGADVRLYKIYFSPYEEDPLTLLVSTTDTFFVHSSLASLAGCYSVTAVDRSGNESTLLDKTCVDNCLEYRLPNTIFPDRSINNVFTPSCFSRAFIENVNLTIYNRWGKAVYEGDVPPEINWSGISEGNSIGITSGIYYYSLKVKAKRLRRKDENMTFKGWIYVVKQ